MAQSPVLYALHDKYRQIKGELTALDNQSEKLRADMMNLEKTIILFANDWSGDDLKGRKPNRPSRWAKRGLGQQTALALLREATAPMSSREIVIAITERLILIGNAQPVGNDARSKPAAAQSNKNPAKDANVAAGISRIGNALETQNAKDDPYEEERNEREIRDLEAQEKSAYWAEQMFWSTLAAVILSVIGIALVWTTFRETRNANILMKATQRARIEAKLEVIDVKSGYLVLTLRGENIGGSVALNVSAQVQMSENPINPYTPMPEPSHEHIVKSGDGQTFTVMSSPVEYPHPFYVGGRTIYRCIFGDDHESWFCFHVLPGRERTPFGEYVQSSSRHAAIRSAKGIEWPNDT